MRISGRSWTIAIAAMLLLVVLVYVSWKATYRQSDCECHFLRPIHVSGEETHVRDIILPNEELLKLYELSVEFQSYVIRLDGSEDAFLHPHDEFYRSLSEFSTLSLPPENYKTVAGFVVFRPTNRVVCRSSAGVEEVVPPFVVKVYSIDGRAGLVGYSLGQNISKIGVLEIQEDLFSEHFEPCIKD